ncbi:MAG: 1-acyl-sn-glycerol-3-phosphate acyltransferase [Balneolaceae bacterium]|nr:1-acyl-sn-glycerol-3-phosphate acyltransferase [Balneolaceae bacterium]
MSEPMTFIDYSRSTLGLLLFVILFIIAIPLILVIIILSFGNATDFVIRTFAPGIARPVLWVSGINFKVKQHGKRYDGPAVVIINHSSTLDILTMMAIGMDKIRLVAKWELQYFPFFFIVGRLTGQVFIKRQKREQAINTLKNTYERLQKQRLSVMVAPEGSRKHEGIIGPFKKGAFRMAIDLGYPIVPIYFEGNRALSFGGSMMTRGGNLTAHIHPPIDTSDWSLDTINDHIKEVRDLYLGWTGVTDESNSGHEVLNAK